MTPEAIVQALGAAATTAMREKGLELIEAGQDVGTELPVRAALGVAATFVGVSTTIARAVLSSKRVHAISREAFLREAADAYDRFGGA